MKLVLTLIGPPRLMGARQRYELEAGSLSIGRSPEADWVISDVDRLISRLHLRIDASYGEFVLTDISANGVYVNGSDQPVGYGASVKLHDGDQLQAGEAQIAVGIEAQSAARPDAHPAGIDPFAGYPSAPQPEQKPNHDPFGGPFGAAAPAATAGEQPAAWSRIDANWMNPVAALDPAVERADPVVLPLRPGRPILPPRSSTRSILDLVEARPDLPIHRLASAIDAAGREIDEGAWRAFRERVEALLRGDETAF